MGALWAVLLSFRFANHRSFRDEQQLNLGAIYDGDQPGRPNPVRVAGLFGANASGKSNVLHALSFMRGLAVLSDREVEPGQGISRFPFRLDRDSVGAPSRYVVDLLLDGVRHTYGFTIDNERVLEEWLFHYPRNRQRRVFERTGDDFAFGEESRRLTELQRIAEITAPSALLLSTAARFNTSRSEAGAQAEPLRAVYGWFQRLQTRLEPGLRSWFGSRSLPDSDAERTVVVNLLRAADVGLIDVTVPPMVDVGVPPPDDPADGESLDGRFRDWMASLPRPRRLRFVHRAGDSTATLNIEDESAGTRQLLDLAIDAAAALRSGGVLAVDEIDASLHPLLTARMIGLFKSSASNPMGSQLLFSSHDATLLGTLDGEEVLARDQVWFSEKDSAGVSTIYPLAEFRPRKEGENRQRRYLNGNYGGVPELSADLFEQALVARGEFGGEGAA